MNYLPTQSTSYGPQRAAPPAPRFAPGGHPEPLAYAAQLDREADLHLSEGRGELADRLAHLALEHRCRAKWCRA